MKFSKQRLTICIHNYLTMMSQFDLTWLYDVIIRNSVFQLAFVTREFQIPW